ncbi:deoxynucleoside triphosphate triphosphohydrolase SAMHD1-like [Astyanax mexicanus]|uniref:deoxynucleoside triphosphate triphosphohydrolase SAMHD1-like n=1 Tax=Astyanax mexicanus TaxID=7994 RepID=UPI0020CAB5C2|nr:deoxynucleoside triphosphate triphosphohydrolase SAMHD1-like [Astyanax mexicanus]
MADQPTSTQVYKVFNDSVHGHIEMHPLLVKIIDTPEFQRLRNVKQFGGGYYVYPGASHNRFEHSLGVAHLAGKLVQNLKDSQPDLGIDEEDELCVQIAGLCHDLGHGPFSHAFDDFMDQVQEDDKWKHEDQSVKMFDHLIIKGHIKGIMEKKYNLKNEDFEFIKELINPDKDNKTEWQFKGRTQEKSFLYEIVANKLTGIDVDKMDYFSRDCHHLGMTSNFSHERYMMFARVCTDENGEKHICMRDKEAVNMYELFHVRNLIRQRACHHRVAKAVELMITDALIEANSHFKLGEENLTICEAVNDLNTFTHLTDDILQEIERSTDDNLKQSQEIIKRIRDRDLYRYVDGELFKRNEVRSLKTTKEKKDLLEKWIKKITNQQTNLSPEEQQLKDFLDKKTNQHPKLSAEDFRIVVIDLTYGMEESNPIDSLLFYKKNQPDKSYKLSKAKVSHMLPGTFAETRVMLFYKGLPKKHVKTLWEKLKQVSGEPTGAVSGEPTGDVSGEPTGDVSGEPTGDVSGEPTGDVSGEPTGDVSGEPTGDVSGEPTGDVSGEPTGDVSGEPTGDVSGEPTGDVSGEPTGDVSGEPTGDVSGEPTGDVSGEPTGDTPVDPTDKGIYIHLEGEITTSLTSQQIINMCEDDNYQFFDDKTFEYTDLQHWTNAEMWERKLDAWLKEVKNELDGKKPDLELKDFLMVSYCFNTTLIKFMLFYKGLSKIDVKEFWDLVKAKH